MLDVEQLLKTLEEAGYDTTEAVEVLETIVESRRENDT
ncbi:hypothetical protein PAV_11c01870 [Paenibacillus alvei DSM 29]|nr:hypothetical protein PAV_11c01870 [Paenibacillus alvei DSM 29]